MLSNVKKRSLAIVISITDITPTTQNITKNITNIIVSIMTAQTIMIHQNITRTVLNTTNKVIAAVRDVIIKIYPNTLFIYV